MWGRLLTKAAVLLAVLMGSAAMADEPGTETRTNLKPEGASRPLPAGSAQAANTATAASKTAGARNPRVLIITSRDSAQCHKELERLRKPGGEFAAMQSQGWKIGPAPDNHIQLIDVNEVPELIKQLDATEFPVVACVNEDEIVRSFKDGCSTPLDAWTFGWLLKGINERPKAPIPEAVRVATTGSYPLRGNHWSVDGDSNPTKETLVSHLRTPTHTNYLQASWKLEDWSTEELRSLHDDLHEKYGPPAASAASSNVTPGNPAGFDVGIRKGLGK